MSIEKLIEIDRLMILGLWMYWGYVMGMAVSYRDRRGIIRMGIVGIIMILVTIWAYSVL